MALPAHLEHYDELIDLLVDALVQSLDPAAQTSDAPAGTAGLPPRATIPLSLEIKPGRGRTRTRTTHWSRSIPA